MLQLITVTDRFQIEGRGCVLAPGLSRSALWTGFRAAVLLGTLLAAEIGTAAAVRIRLETTDLNSNVVSSVNVGEQFLLRGFVSDVRAAPQGVFASYLDVVYSPAASVTVAGAVTFIAPFTLQASANLTNAGFIDELGASSSSFTPTGGAEKPQFNVRFQASAPGIITFTGDPADVTPAHDVLVYGLNTAISTNDLQFVNTTITVNGTALRISRIEVGTNGAHLTLTGPQNATIQVQTVTNLTNTGWLDVGSSVLLGTAGTTGFMDLIATNHPIRFYRAYQP